MKPRVAAGSRVAAFAEFVSYVQGARPAAAVRWIVIWLAVPPGFSHSRKFWFAGSTAAVPPLDRTVGKRTAVPATVTRVSALPSSFAGLLSTWSAVGRAVFVWTPAAVAWPVIVKLCCERGPSAGELRVHV